MTADSFNEISKFAPYEKGDTVKITDGARQTIAFKLR